MSLINSLFAGVSGLKNHQSMMDVIGNNIANVNSIGYKGSRVTFTDTFNQFVKAGSNPTETSGGTNTYQIGLGMKISSIDRNWNQGTFERTGIITDLALQGDGLFVLKSGGQTFYSRAGSFNFDADGKLVTANGAVVQGKVANGLGEIPSGNSLQDIQVDNNLRLPAIATTECTWGGNLSSSSSVTRSENVIMNGNLNSGAAVGATSGNIDSTIYDQNGAAFTLRSVYTKTAADAWNLTYNILDSAGNSVYGGAGEDPLPAAVAVTFNASGVMTAPAAPISISPLGTGLNFDLDPTGVTQESSTTTSNVSALADAGRDPNIVNGTVTIFDSLGNSHSLTISYTKTSDNNWNWSASMPAESGTLTGNSGSIIFNPDGSINSVTPSAPLLSFTPTGGADLQTIALDFGSGLTGISQTSLSSTISALNQNGAASATLSNLNIDQYGNIVGVFTNGYTRTLAQIMVATFSNRNGLEGVGDNMFTISANSGSAVVGQLGDSTATTLQSGTLEQSNVDLSEEFTKMIVSQRGFQANARVITTADTLLQEVTNLVR